MDGKSFKTSVGFCFSLLLMILQDCDGLKSMKIHVPEVAKSGDTVTLACDYDLEQVALYSVKWYRNDEEFYRYVPKESPPFRAFSMPHINVDISRSGPTEVTLLGVRRELTGDYKCEVSADAPLFHTGIKMAHMIVAELPSGDPVINIDPIKVEAGKKITAECYSPGSDPPANLTWFINDEPILEDSKEVRVHPLKIETDSALGLHSSKARIELVANRSIFIMGSMTLKCEASIYTLWKKIAEGVVRDETPQLAPVLGSTSSQSHTTDNLEYYSESSSPSPNCSKTITITIILLFYLIR